MEGAKVKRGYITRRGRGYSIEELKEAGIDMRIARKNRVPVDMWRQTKHQENVDQLKPIVKNLKPEKKKE